MYVWADDAGVEVSGWVRCTTDDECASPPLQGRCVVMPGPTVATESTECVVGCITDGDCAGDVCECYSDTGKTGVCVSAGCHQDSECPSGVCARYPASYACATSDDECRTDADCGPVIRDCGSTETTYRLCASPKDGLGSRCFEDVVQHPSSRNCEGRPFIVDGAARVALIQSRTDWSSTLEPALDSLSQAERQLLGEHWIRTAQMEHASIGAFARFGLQLLALGAPATFIEATHRAMADEVVHAKLAFGLASAYLDRNLGPAALNCADALDGTDLRSIALSTFREGCIGETIAALDAEIALQDCEAPAVRHVLQTIAHDEAKHTELAWRFTAWALEQAPHLRDELLTLADQQHKRAAAELRPAPSDCDWQRAHGVHLERRIGRRDRFHESSSGSG